MGKASSNKKVARAAKAGGSRARAAGERNLLFPSVLALVVVLGTLLIVYARDNRSAQALESPIAFEDHWHSSYGFYVCDSFLTPLPEYTAPQNGGTHTHGDGLIHIHPFSSARAGANATLENFLADAGTVLGGGNEVTDSGLGVPGGKTYVEGDDTCEGLDGDPIVQVAVWDSAFDALQENPPDRVITENFDDIRFDNEGQAFTLAFAPEGAELPPPPSTADLSGVGSALGVDTSDISIPEGKDLTDIGGTDDTTPDSTEGDDTTDGDGSTDTTVSDDTTDTTVSDDTTDTTVTDDTTDTTKGPDGTTGTSLDGDAPDGSGDG